MYRVDIWHNITWASYKAAVFSSLFGQQNELHLQVKFFQIAETESDRVLLNGVDYSAHKYPFHLLFRGRYSDVPWVYLALSLARRILSSDAELIVLAGYHRPEYWVQLLAGKLRGKKVAFFCDSTAYDRPPNRMKSVLKRLFFSTADGAFCYGERSRSYLVANGAHPEKIFVRCQAAAQVPGYDEGEALSARVRLFPATPRFLYVGRLSEEKDLPTLIRAFARLYAENKSAELLLVGAGPEGDRLRSLAADLGISTAVIFCGPRTREELPEFYGAATAMVLPSTSEPWGLVVNEALSFGCPAIVSHACGCGPELVVSGRTGLIFRAGDVSGLTERMNESLVAFADAAATARACLAHIATYSPERAALQIGKGCRVLLEAENAR